MRIQRHILGQLLAAFALVALIVTSVIFAAMLLQYLHRYPELGLLSILRAAPYVMALAFPITLPLSFLVACLLTYGRFADDNEFLALQMGGIHPWHAAAPALAAAGLLTVGTVVLNTDVLPYASLAKREIARGEIRQLLTAIEDPVRESIVMRGFQMSWNGRDAQGLRNVLITWDIDKVDASGEGKVRTTQRVQAAHGRVDVTRLGEDVFLLDLDDVEMQTRDGDQTTRVHEASRLVAIPTMVEKGKPCSLSILGEIWNGFGGVFESIVPRVDAFHEASRLVAISLDEIAGLPPAYNSKSADEMSAAQLWYRVRRLRSITMDVRTSDAEDRGQREDLKLLRSYEVAFWRRFALGLAPLSFACVGVALGLAGGKGSRMAAFLTAVLVALPVYYPLLLLGANIARDGLLPAGLAMNLCNLVLAAGGLWKLWRVVS